MGASETIKKLRLQLCLSKSEFADQLKLHRSAITNYESGARAPKMAVIRSIIKLASKHKIKITYDDFVKD